MTLAVATDPMQSERQRRAMYAAAAGNSNIGIPRSVGEKFTEHDRGGKKPERAKDMERSDWRELFGGFGKFLKLLIEEAGEPEHAADDQGYEDSEVKRRGAGVLLMAPDGRVLFLKRTSKSDHPGTWGFPGGLIEEGEEPAEAALRELAEEVGDLSDAFGDDCVMDCDSLTAVDNTLIEGTSFVTFGRDIPRIFDPKLCDEHDEHCWATLDAPPEPLHPGVKATIDCVNDRMAAAADAEEDDGAAPKPETGKWISMREQFEEAADAIQLHNREVPKDYKWALSGKVGTGEGVTKMAREVKRDMAAVARDEALILAYDRATVEHVEGVRYHLEFDPTILAYDRDTVRDKDQDGRLHISRSHISKATVNPYYGKEIPNYEKLGLDADKKYMLLRDPEELAKGAATFNNVPILSQHVPLTAANHDPDLVIGSTGTDSIYEHPYLDNSLVFWPQAAIDAIEDDDVKQLSCCYHYDPDMTPGEFEGQKYDGVMRNIRGNHVALVPEGRAGADVMVMDAMPKPKFAADAPPRFEESKHKRDHGKFSSGGGSSGPSGGGSSETHAHPSAHGGKTASGQFPTHTHATPEAHAALTNAGHRLAPMHHRPGVSTTYHKGTPGEGTQHSVSIMPHEGEGGAHWNSYRTTENGSRAIGANSGMESLVKHVNRVHGRKSKDARLAGDSKESRKMKTRALSPGAQVAKGALMAYLGPKLAADANIALNPLLAGVTGKNMKSKRDQIAAAVKTAVTGKLAADADVDDIADMLEGIEEICRAEEEPAASSLDDNPAGNANSAVPPFAREDEDARDEVPGITPEAEAFLKSKLSPEDYAALCDMSKPAGEDDDVTVVQTDDDPATAGDRRRAADEPPPFPGRPTPGGKLVTKEAMDAAIAAASTSTEKRVRAQMRSISDAHNDVKPYVGDITSMAFDSAEGVYRHALKMMQVEGADTIHESALKTILGMQPKAVKRQGANTPAMDALGGGGSNGGGAVPGIATRFPGVAERIGRM